MSRSDATGLIVLAAGASKRLGQPKQLASYKNQPLLQHTINIALETNCIPQVLVLGAHAEDILSKVKTGTLDVQINEDWEEGLAGSIRCGLSFLLDKDPSIQHVLILLCDQPYLSANHLINLLNKQESDNSITASEYDGQPGVPAIFGRAYFQDLMSLEGDQGAKKILLKNDDSVNRIPFEKGEVDIDTPEDYQKLIS